MLDNAFQVTTYQSNRSYRKIKRATLLEILCTLLMFVLFAKQALRIESTNISLFKIWNNSFLFRCCKKPTKFATGLDRI